MTAFQLAALAALVWGSAAFCEKMGLVRADPLVGLWVRSVGVFVGGAALTFFIPQFGAKFAAAGWASHAWLFGGGILASILGQIFFYRALKIGEIGKVASVGGSWPLVAFVLSMVFLGEAPTPRKFAGVALVFAGVSLLK
jgi:bacterial/archaeal transporter family protein